MKNAAYAVFCVTFWSVVLTAVGAAGAVAFYALYTL